MPRPGWARTSANVVQVRQNGWLVDVVGLPSDLMPPRPGTDLPAVVARRMKAIGAVQQTLRRRTARAPQIGTRRAVCLLIQYSDMAATLPASHYDDLLFSQGTYNVGAGSMHDYYQKASHGQLDFTGQVTGSWLTASQTHDYYADGQYGDGTFPKNVQGLVAEAVALADPIVDFSQYDNDGDGMVDNLMVVHAGPGAEFTTNVNDIWSQSWGLDTPVMVDGVAAQNFIIQPEDGGVGVFCHEMGHGLGLPDLYDRDNSSQGVGNYCLMAGGSWLGSSGGVYGTDPGVMSAWCRAALGWVTPINVTAPRPGTILTPSDVGGTPAQDVVYRLWRRGASSQEYFLVENMQHSQLPSRGLMIWHCDDANNDYFIQNDFEWYPGQPTNQHYLVALEQADGRWDMEHKRNRGDANDAYPLALASAFDGTTTPSSHAYDDSDSEVKLQNILRQGANIQLDMTPTNVGPPTQIEIVQQPTTTAATQPITPAVSVRLLDATGTLVDWSTQNVTVAIQNNPGGSTLAGTTTVPVVGGVGTFANLALNKAATGYTLKISSAGCPDVVSSAFDIVPGPAASCAIVVDPTDVAAGAQISPPVEVQLYDVDNNAASLDNTTVVSVRIQPSSNATSATLGGTTSATARAGRVRFTDLYMDKVGTGYRLEATISGATSQPSAVFRVTAGQPSALTMVTSPGDSTAGAALAPTPRVLITDAFGNDATTATNNVSVTVEVGSGTPPTLAGTVTRAASAGLATFSDLVLTLAGSGYQLRFTSPGLTDAVSTPFDIVPGAAAAMAWVQQPVATQALATMSPGPRLQLLDAYGNVAANDSATTVDLTLGSNPTSATLAGTLTATAQAGLVAFGDLSVNRVGTGYTLLASSTGKPAVASEPFAILERTPDPTRSTVTISPPTIGIDGQDATLHIVLLDSIGLPVQGSPRGARSLVANPATGVTISDAGAASDDDGRCEVKIRSTVPGGYTVAPRIGSVTLASVPLVVKQVFSQDYAAGLHCLGLPLDNTDGRPLTVLGAAGWRMARYDADSNAFVAFGETDNDDPRFSFARARAPCGCWARSRPTSRST
ncbi:MAG: M6 family metalloprotease domain-containing protein [Armatimonadetes bacterium]|nr:M6 family metalloprotease domain-containing protein [Armatimonadota bacterium]